MKSRVQYILLICFIFLSFTNLYSKFNDIDTYSEGLLEELIKKYMSENHVVGMSLSLIKNGKIVYMNGYGYRDLDANIPANEYTMYRTASIAKTITSISALQLVEKGRLDLNADIRQYVPEFPEKPEGIITPLNLLTHTSGIRHYEEYNSSLAESYEKIYTSFNSLAAIDIFKYGTLMFPPGTSYNYSSFGYILLGAVIERADSSDFMLQVENRVFRPMNMPYIREESKLYRPYYNESKGYYIDKLGVPKEIRRDKGILYKAPGGGLISTVIDISYLVQGLFNNSFFEEKETLEMMYSHPLGTHSYSLGLFRGRHKDKQYYFHTGNQSKTSTIFLYYPETGDGIVVMMNTPVLSQLNLALGISDILDGVKLRGNVFKPIPKELKVPVKTFPVDYEVIVTDNVQLYWESAPYTNQYVVEYWQDSLYSRSKFDTLYTTNMEIKNVPRGTKFFWRIKGINRYLYGFTESPWSSTWNFSTSLFTIREKEVRQELAIIPNPNKGSFQFSVPVPGISENNVEIFDAFDMKVKAKVTRISDTLYVKLDKNIPGVYYISVRTYLGKSFKAKFLVTK